MHGLLSGSAPTDPLYLTNRTLSQKMRPWLLIGIPCLLLVAGIGIALSRLLAPPAMRPVKELTAQEITAKLLPKLEQDLKVTANTNLQVVEVAVRQQGGPHVLGVIHNNTAHEIASLQVVVDLTDNAGSQVGGVSTIVEKLPPNANK